MTIIEELQFTKEYLKAIIQSHVPTKREGTNALLGKLQKVVDTGEDSEIDLIELWKLYHCSNPETLKGTEYESLADELLPRLDKAMEDYIFSEGYPATITLDI